MNDFPSNVKLLSTQRIFDGGKSSGNFENFNLALHVNDNKDSVLENRKMLRFHYDLPSEPIWINQTHSSICIDAASIKTTIEADAIYSSKVGVVCAIMTADCLPVFISKKDGTMVGIAHAGWRGLKSRIIENFFSKISTVHLSDFRVLLGPCISQSNYEVNDEIISHFSNYSKRFEKNNSGNYYMDLRLIAYDILTELGITDVTISERWHCS